MKTMFVFKLFRKIQRLLSYSEKNIITAKEYESSLISVQIHKTLQIISNERGNFTNDDSFQKKC